jgi:hypothetical protein
MKTTFLEFEQPIAELETIRRSTSPKRSSG